MSRKLDQELADAIESSEKQGASEDDAPGLEKPAGAEPRRGPKRKKNNWGLLVVLLVMVAGVASLMLVGFNDAAVYAVDVKKVREGGADMVGRKLRVEGELVPGTLVKRDDPCEYRFVMHVEDAQMQVSYPKCVIPDTFRDRPEGGVQVTVEGTLGSEEQFDASLVMAKCSSKYDPESHEMQLSDGSKSNGDPANEPAVDDGTIR